MTRSFFNGTRQNPNISKHTKRSPRISLHETRRKGLRLCFCSRLQNPGCGRRGRSPCARYVCATDLSSAAVDKVKIPKKWDDSFTAFNQVVQESDLDLSDYKGKTVEKWTLLCPALSTGDQDTYCVLLVYKAKAIGAYLLEKPSGEVTGLITAAKASAETAAAEQEDTQAAAVETEIEYPTE